MVSGPKETGECRDACKFQECVHWMWREKSGGGICYHLSSYYNDSVGFSSGELDCDEKPTCQMSKDAGLAYLTRQIKESQASACRSISCPRDSVCKLFSYEESTKICHVIVTYAKKRRGFVTGTPCA